MINRRIFRGAIEESAFHRVVMRRSGLTMELAMDRADIEKTLSWMNPQVLRRVQGRRVKAYVGSLDRNFYLKNPSGRRVSSAVMIRLAHGGITIGWKKGAEIWSHDVHLLEIGLMKLAQSQR